MGQDSKDFREILSDINEVAPFVVEISDRDKLDESYNDKYSTDQQKERDKIITRLLRCYVDTYDDKRKRNKTYKDQLFELCYNIVGGSTLALLFAFVLLIVVKKDGLLNVEGLSALITVCVTYLTTIIALLKIITEYVFPQKEEEYITKVVELIQQNDLEHKKANMRAERKKK